MPLRIQNQTRDTLLGEAIEVADTSAARRVGLLRHRSLEPGRGLWIVPSEAVHSFGMKFAIDVIFLDRKRKVRKLTPGMAPRRIAICWTAHSILELPVGTILATRTEPGDQLAFEKV